jgi:hypothetical protein
LHNLSLIMFNLLTLPQSTSTTFNSTAFLSDDCQTWKFILLEMEPNSNVKPLQLSTFLNNIFLLQGWVLVDDRRIHYPKLSWNRNYCCFDHDDLVLKIKSFEERKCHWIWETFGISTSTSQTKLEVFIKAIIASCK